MKIAIQGHPTRGKEVIQILESLGGRNTCNLSGNSTYYEHYYLIDNRSIITISSKYNLHNCKFYTLEEFEKEFPFKIGDKVITSYGDVGIILALTPDNNEIPYCVETEKGNIYRHQSELKLYKEMKEERNITLTLDKAKEWYKKGGELKEVALQAYSEGELTKVELPKTWKEFCNNYPMKDGMAYIGASSDIRVITSCSDDDFRDKDEDKNLCPSKKSAEAHLAMIQLEQLRNCWWNGWEPKWDTSTKYTIRNNKNELCVLLAYNVTVFLVFPTREMAEKFLKCFRDLIEKAGDLI